MAVPTWAIDVCVNPTNDLLKGDLCQEMVLKVTVRSPRQHHGTSVSDEVRQRYRIVELAQVCQRELQVQ